MKRTFKLLFFACLFVAANLNFVLAQTMTTYTWDSYKTKFDVPSNFDVTTSTGEEWSGTNGDITMSIYPQTGVTMTKPEMSRSVRKWATDNAVTNLTEVTEIDSEKLNGYWGVFVEGMNSGFPVFATLIVDPDYPDTSLYIWVSYKEGQEDLVVKMLMSFKPN